MLRYVTLVFASLVVTVCVEVVYVAMAVPLQPASSDPVRALLNAMAVVHLFVLVPLILGALAHTALMHVYMKSWGRRRVTASTLLGVCLGTALALFLGRDEQLPWLLLWGAGLGVYGAVSSLIVPFPKKTT
jgi:ACR3 family arsenite efflux pump ArsB